MQEKLLVFGRTLKKVTLSKKFALKYFFPYRYRSSKFDDIIEQTNGPLTFGRGSSRFLQKHQMEHFRTEILLETNFFLTKSLTKYGSNISKNGIIVSLCVENKAWNTSEILLNKYVSSSCWKRFYFSKEFLGYKYLFYFSFEFFFRFFVVIFILPRF